VTAIIPRDNINLYKYFININIHHQSLDFRILAEFGGSLILFLDRILNPFKYALIIKMYDMLAILDFHILVSW
jgi:hypothetical protein